MGKQFEVRHNILTDCVAKFGEILDMISTQPINLPEILEKIQSIEYSIKENRRILFKIPTGARLDPNEIKMAMGEVVGFSMQTIISDKNSKKIKDALINLPEIIDSIKDKSQQQSLRDFVSIPLTDYFTEQSRQVLQDENVKRLLENTSDQIDTADLLYFSPYYDKAIRLLNLIKSSELQSIFSSLAINLEKLEKLEKFHDNLPNEKKDFLDNMLKMRELIANLTENSRNDLMDLFNHFLSNDEIKKYGTSGVIDAILLDIKFGLPALEQL